MNKNALLLQTDLDIHKIKIKTDNETLTWLAKQ